MLDKLIGAQILKVNNNSIDIKLGDKSYMLEVIEDNGLCCGYANFTTNLLYSENDFRNPIITNVELKSSENYDGVSSVITFYGESKPLANIESEAGSDSCFQYGASVTLWCKALEIEEDLVSW